MNNLVEQDHRRIKQRIRPMLGFKRFDHAVVTITGIELAEKIKKGQFKTGKFGNREIYYVGTLERCPCRLTDVLQRASGASGRLIW